MVMNILSIRPKLLYFIEPSKIEWVPHLQHRTHSFCNTCYCHKNICLLWKHHSFCNTCYCHNVIKNMPTDKSLGSDGFNAAFLKGCWDIIAQDFYRLIEDFYQGTVNIQSINYSFITLTPKTDSASSPAEFRPISLLNCTLKIITKLLANRL